MVSFFNSLSSRRTGVFKRRIVYPLSGLPVYRLRKMQRINKNQNLRKTDEKLILQEGYYTPTRIYYFILFLHCLNLILYTQYSILIFYLSFHFSLYNMQEKKEKTQ